MNEWMNKNEMGRQFIKSRQWIVYQLKKEGSGKYLHIERAHLHVEADRMMNGLPSTTDVNGQCPNRRGRRRTNQRRAPGHVTRHKQAYGPHQRRHYSPIKSGLIGNRLHQSILQQIFSKKNQDLCPWHISMIIQLQWTAPTTATTWINQSSIIECGPVTRGGHLSADCAKLPPGGGGGEEICMPLLSGPLAGKISNNSNNK